MNYNLYKNKYKIVFVGDSNVGKTSILNSYTKKCNHIPKITIGTEFIERYMKTHDITLQIWDCAGQEKFRALTKLYYRSTHVCILVFDLTNPESLEAIQNYWIKTVKEQCDNVIEFILIGNKNDLTTRVDYKIVWDICKKYNIKYIETSAVNNLNIANIFDSICSLLLNKNTKPLYNNYGKDIDTVNLTEEDTFSLHNIYSYC